MRIKLDCRYYATTSLLDLVSSRLLATIYSTSTDTYRDCTTITYTYTVPIAIGRIGIEVKD